jgi:Protein of unknown function (DUF3108)
MALVAGIMGFFPNMPVSGANAAGQQPSNRKPNKAKKPPLESPRDMAVPFRAGEKLNYQVSWSAFMSAANVQMTIPEQRNLYGRNTWHFRATGHTQGTARTLFTIDDEFDSYTDTAMTNGRQYETYLNEMGRKQDQVLHFVVEGQPNDAPGTGVIVLKGTLDPLGALYTLRTIDWQKTPEWQAPVYDGRDVYELHAKMEVPSEDVTVAGGKFSATRISLHVRKHGKELTDIDFSAWIAHDTSRTPVLMRAELPLGSVSIELTSASQ